jgi:hypothetical protein
MISCILKTSYQLRRILYQQTQKSSLMKNLLFYFLFVTASHIACGQIPTSGNLLWLRADMGVFNNNSGTQAIPGDLVHVWEDQSGSGNHFYQDANGYRPQLIAIANTLCSKPLIQFDVSRRTYLGSTFKLSGPKTIFIAFLQPSLVGNPETLLSIKGISNTYTEILCADHPAYRPLSYISELPSSLSGGTMLSALGNNVSFSLAGNIFSMTYDGGAISSPSSYSSNFDSAPYAVASSGLFGRLINDTSTIGARAPEQNTGFLSGCIAEIIVYNRVLTVAEINQVETYLLGKYGFQNSCSVLPIYNTSFTAKQINSTMQLDWNMDDETNLKDYIAEHSLDRDKWIIVDKRNAGTKKYQVIHSTPSFGNNYYRLKMKYDDGRIRYSHVNQINFYTPGGGNLHISPNPATDFFYVRSEKTELLHLRIITAEGRVLKKITTYSNSKVDISDLMPGIYIINLAGKNEKLIKR